jgi:hypothetical protein
MYISNYCFSSSVSFEQKNKIFSEFNSEWDFVKNFISHKHKITVSAIQLSEIIKPQLGLNLFPLIRTCAIKGYKYDGQMQFYMLGIGEHNYYYFDYPRKFYNKKGIKLEFGLCRNDNIITIKE